MCRLNSSNPDRGSCRTESCQGVKWARHHRHSQSLSNCSTAWPPCKLLKMLVFISSLCLVLASVSGQDDVQVDTLFTSKLLRGWLVPARGGGPAGMPGRGQEQGWGRHSCHLQGGLENSWMDMMSRSQGFLADGSVFDSNEDKDPIR